MPADQLKKAATAAKAGQWEVLEDLIGSVVEVDQIPTGRSYNILHQIAWHGNTEILEKLHDKGIRFDMFCKSKQGETPIKIAQSRNHDDMTLALQVLTMLQAAKTGSWKLLEEMLHTPARYRLNTLIKPFKWGVLHQIAYWGALKELKKFVEQGVAFDFHFKTLDGQTAEEVAKAAGHPKVAGALRKLAQQQDDGTLPAPASVSGASSGAAAASGTAAAAGTSTTAAPAAAAAADAGASSSAAAASSSGAAAGSSSGPGGPDDVCVVCMDAPKDAVFVHGTSAHQACCLACAKKLKATLKKCPICKLKIDAVAKNFFV